jgi:putative lipoprotein
MAGDYLAAERRYTQTRSAPGAPLVVAFDGRLEVRAAMDGPTREHIVVDRFGGAELDAHCNTPTAAQGTAEASLKDTYWKLVELDGKVIATAPAQQREVRITLASVGSRVTGFSGCNQFIGGYEHEGAALRFKQLAGTMMACISPLMELEVQVLKMLGTASGYRIEGQRLVLLSGDHVHARFDAVYLR